MSASPIQIARAKFVDDCWAAARALDDNRVYGLGQAALNVHGETVLFWRRLSRRLLDWRASYDPKSAETRILFDGLAGSLRADVTWQSTCETCNGEGEVCILCGEADLDNGCSHFAGNCPDCSAIAEEVSRG